jgi:subtilisin family serine protease
VALLGSGIDPSHPAFRDVTIIQKDFSGEGNGDRNGHSTHTAGTIFGRRVGTSRFGIAPGVTTVLVAKVLDHTGVGANALMLAGLRWVLSHATRPDVVCVPVGLDMVWLISSQVRSAASDDEATRALAWGLHEYLEELRTYRSISVLASLVDKGSVLVMPAGNDSRDDARVPVTSSISAIEGVMSVGAVEPAGTAYRVASYSNAVPTVCAPGSRVLSTGLQGRLVEMSGTSMSCAHAAGVAQA